MQQTEQTQPKPELTGTEKQIAWALQIREHLQPIFRPKQTDSGNGKYAIFQVAAFVQSEDKIDLLRSHPERRESIVNEVLAFWNELMALKTAASWWIDHRDMPVRDLIFETYGFQAKITFSAIAAGENHATARATAKKAIEQAAAKTAEKAALEKAARAEATIFVEDAISPLLVEIAARAGTITVFFPEINKTLITIVKRLGFTWDGIWKAVTPKTWTEIDQAAEVGHALLQAKFNVLIFDEKVRAMAKEGTFHKQVVRWVRTTSDRKFLITWKREEADFYHVALRLPGACWSKPAMHVPAEAFSEVELFVKENGFALSEDAQTLIEETKAIKAQRTIVPSVSSTKVE